MQFVDSRLHILKLAIKSSQIRSSQKSLLARNDVSYLVQFSSFSDKNEKLHTEFISLWGEENNFFFPLSKYFLCSVLDTKEDTGLWCFGVMQVCPLLSSQTSVHGRRETSVFCYFLSELHTPWTKPTLCFLLLHLNTIKLFCVWYCADMTCSECLLIIYNICVWLQNELSGTNCLQQLVACSLNQSQTHPEAHSHNSF